jgi:hypothetical protein
LPLRPAEANPIQKRGGFAEELSPASRRHVMREAEIQSYGAESLSGPPEKHREPCDELGDPSACPARVLGIVLGFPAVKEASLAIGGSSPCRRESLRRNKASRLSREPTFATSRW